MTRDRLASIAPARLLLGIDGGATRTVARLATEDLYPVRRIEAGPGNVRLLTEAQLRGLFSCLAVPARSLLAIAIGMAGARTESDRRRIMEAAATVWPGVPTLVTHDLETGLAAQPQSRSGPTAVARVLVLSGTGSCCFGRDRSGHTTKAGGWGHLLGDQGSSYDIGLRAIRGAVARFDAASRWPALGTRLLRKTHLNAPDDLITWTQQAGKDDLAALAPEVFTAARHGDALARDILHEAARALAANALACAMRLAPRGRCVEFVLAGGTLLHQVSFARAVSREIRSGWPNACITRLRCEGAWGAVLLALDLSRAGRSPQISTESSAYRPGGAAPWVSDKGRTSKSAQPRTPDHGLPVIDRNLEGDTSEMRPLPWLAQSPTERRHPRSMNLHRLSIADGIRLFLSEDATIPAALLAERRPLEKACRAIARALSSGGHLVYVGAGTSGRLGVLDASECPPTFRTPPDLVQGIIAGGQRALWEAVEGAEDDPAAGAQAIAFRRLGRRDTIVGIAASGRTPFVWGALHAAKSRGATTILLCFNPTLKRLRRGRPDIVIAPNLGPELLTGSTRLKCGTATKLVLNLFTTLTMVRLGKVVSNLMIDLNPSNVKLRDRAVRIVTELTGASANDARRTLDRSGWVVKRALARLARRGGALGQPERPRHPA